MLRDNVRFRSVEYMGPCSDAILGGILQDCVLDFYDEKLPLLLGTRFAWWSPKVQLLNQIIHFWYISYWYIQTFVHKQQTLNIRREAIKIGWIRETHGNWYKRDLLRADWDFFPSYNGGINYLCCEIMCFSYS